MIFSFRTYNNRHRNKQYPMFQQSIQRISAVGVPWNVGLLACRFFNFKVACIQGRVIRLGNRGHDILQDMGVV